MPGGNIDILKRLPDVAAIGRTQLQAYCDDWLKRPIAREYGITHLILGSDLMLNVNLDLARVEDRGDRVFVPICGLLDYIIEQHFQDAGKRAELHAEARDIRKRWTKSDWNTQRRPRESATSGSSARIRLATHQWKQSSRRLRARLLQCGRCRSPARVAGTRIGIMAAICT
jgi:hypothetical protein